jgi:hypothetical protein
MANEVPRGVILCGTESMEAANRLLRAGSLTVELEAGALRYVRFDEIEVIRGISFLIRDEDWGTFAPAISDLKIEEADGEFSVTYWGVCADSQRRLTYEAQINGNADGTLEFRVVAKAETDVLTNRAGFVVLHPIAGVAGRPVRVRHADNEDSIERFPELISPGQPIFDIRTLVHEAAPGMWVTCRMEGDAYEMEDQRNWSDASFKTYIRPLSRPRPYVLEKGSRHPQSIHLSIAGRNRGHVDREASRSHPISVAIGAEASVRLPVLGIGMPEVEIPHALAAVDQLRALGPRILSCQIDLRKGVDADTLSAYRRLAEVNRSASFLEIVIRGDRDPREELSALAAAVGHAGLVPEAVIVSPASDLMSHQPGQEDPHVWPPREICAAARAAFPRVRVGGGMFSYFTELNRKRPPTDVIDFVTHSTCPIVHAADDRSVMETLEALPAIAASTRAFIGDLPYRIGPSAIGCRANPYGQSAAANPSNARVCLAQTDPRQRGLFGAAWMLGYIAAFARAGVEAVTLGALTGPFGLVYRRTDYNQPYYDVQAGAAIYPAFHILAGLAADCGSGLLEASLSAQGRIEILSYRRSPTHIRIWLANLTPDPVSVQLTGLPGGSLQGSTIDASVFEQATSDPKSLERLNSTISAQAVRLDAYAFARLDARHQSANK